MFIHQRKEIKKFICLLSLTLVSSAVAMEHEKYRANQEGTSSKMSSTQTSQTITNNYLKPEEIEGLIRKGKNILNEIIGKGTQIEALEHKTEFIQRLGWIKIPTYKNVRNVANRTWNSAWERAGWDMSEARKLEEQEYEHTLARRAQLESLTAVIWALTDYSDKKHESFESGSFSIIDPDGKLYKLFAHYAVFADKMKALNDLPLGIINPINPLGNEFSVARPPKLGCSSHYYYSTIFQFGLDTKFEGCGTPLQVLPFSTTHILVGRVRTYFGNELTFLKFEPYGTSDIYSSIRHTGEYIKSLFYREGKRSEKDIHKKIAPQLINFTGSLSQENMSNILQSGDTPQNIKKMLVNILKNPTSLQDEKNVPYDISSFVQLYNYIYNFSNDTNVRAKIHDLKDIVKTLYPNDSNAKLLFRSGNEVVLDLKEIAMISPYRKTS